MKFNDKAKLDHSQVKPVKWYTAAQLKLKRDLQKRKLVKLK